MYASDLAVLRAIGLAVAVIATAAAAPPAPADNKPAPVPDAQRTVAGPAPRFQAAPVPRQTDGRVRLSAPVAAPYSGTAYRDLGGQPETSADALDRQAPRSR